jgi:magnesium-transporting ATPase (P-type)
MMPWHSMTTEETLSRLDATGQGLTATEAEARLARHGPNRLKPPDPPSPFRRFLAQFHNLLIYVLLASGGVTALLGHWVDTFVILGVVLINAIIGFLQEGKAEKALDAIRRMLSHQATVLRDGRRIAVAAEELVPGDVVFLQSGDRVPADLRLLGVKGLQVQEAALTGESLAVHKAVPPVAEGAALGDRTCMAYSGTLVTFGQGTGAVVATGDETEIGRISELLARVETLTTPLLRQMDRFGRWLTLAILLLAAFAFLAGILWRGYSADEMFLAAVGLAVAAIPEGLPAIVTITLAIGVQRMAARNAIVRRLPAVETLGSVTVICSDKTGTLTRNEMTVRALVTARGLYEATGEGYAPRGSILLDGNEVRPEDHPALGDLARGAALCCDATLREVGDDWLVDGDPMEGALLTLARKAGLDPEFEARACPRTDVIPFESEHRLMATLHHDHEGNGFIFVKGAPERLLALCSAQREGGAEVPLAPEYWQGRMEELAERGQRVLALAVKRTHADHRELAFADLEDGLVLAGLLGLADPPRPEAVAAVAHCRSAGIRVKMITGDHKGTALAIGREFGLAPDRRALTGPELDGLSVEELRHLVPSVDVFARASPEHKLKLVEALQAEGQVVAMTGDGVNDAPALKRADVGVAMGRGGTEAAKEAAEMVLADDNFASIVHAVEEGRTVYDNIRKAIVFILPTNAGEAFTIIGAILLGGVLPITPVQILWVNMITAVTLALALAFEPGEKGVMARPPRDPAAPILDGFLIWRIAFVGLILVTGTFGLFLWEQARGTDLATARTVAVNTLVLFEIFYLFSSRYLREPLAGPEGFLGSRPALVAIAVVLFFQVLFTYAPPMRFLFGTEGLDAWAWVRCVLVASSVLVLVEAEKALVKFVKSRVPPAG